MIEMIEEPVVRGGQGRSDDDVEGAAERFAWCLVGVIAIALVAALLALLGGAR